MAKTSPYQQKKQTDEQKDSSGLSSPGFSPINDTSSFLSGPGYVAEQIDERTRLVGVLVFELPTNLKFKTKNLSAKNRNNAVKS